MNLEQQVQRGTNIIQEFSALDPAEATELPQDIGCLKLWLKAKLDEYGANIAESPEMQAAVEMTVESAFRIGRAENG